jgi:hypothetical protein
MGIAALAAVAAPQGTASSERAVVINLSVAGQSAATVTADRGQRVTLVASAAMQKGDRLMIAVTRGRESALRRVAVCPRSPCTGRWRERNPISDRFQAFLTRGPGARFALVSTSRIVRVVWKAAAPAPPAPTPSPRATPGHYEGRSTFNEAFSFDVSADGKSVVDLRTGQVNESCTPAAFTLSGGNLSAPGPYPIAADGSFTISSTYSISVAFADGTVASGPRKVTITGRFSAGAASGTIRTDTSLTWKGGSYACNSGDQTWTASKV